MCRDNCLDQLIGCLVQHDRTAMWGLCFSICLCTSSSSLLPSTTSLRSPEEEMSATALQRQKLLWRKHARETLCQQATGNVYFRGWLSLPRRPHQTTRSSESAVWHHTSKLDRLNHPTWFLTNALTTVAPDGGIFHIFAYFWHHLNTRFSHKSLRTWLNKWKKK